MEKINITFNKFTCQSSITPLTLYKELIKNPYKSDCGWGFSEVSLLGESISAKLLKEVSASYRVWNADTNSMDKVSYNRIKEIPLLIDFTNNFIIVEGGVTCMNIIKQVLRTIYWNSFVYFSPNITPCDYIAAFHDDKYLESIIELTLDNYKSNNYFLGKYIAKVTVPDFDITLLNEYRDLIGKVKLSLLFENEDVILTVSKTNSMVLSCSDNIKYRFLEYITKITY